MRAKFKSAKRSPGAQGYLITFKLRTEGSKILDGAERLWTKLHGSLKKLGKLFRYFESKNLSSKKQNSFEAFVVGILKSLFQKNEELGDEIIKKSMELIKMLRDEELVNVSQIKNIVEMLLAINLYKKPFEDEFLKQSTEYYKKEAQTQRSNFHLPKFLAYLEKRFEQETQLVNKVIDKSSGKSLMSIVETCLISDNAQKIIESDIESLVFSKDFLSRLYKFLVRVEKIEILKKRWNSIIKDRGMVLVNNMSDHLVEDLLALKYDIEEIIKVSFENNELLKNSMAMAFDAFINFKTNLMAELTSKYIDNRLRKSEKIMVNDEEVEKNINEYLELFKYLSSKDVFEAFYTKRLVKRLLLGQMRSPEMENYVIEKLKKSAIHKMNL